MTPAKYLIDTVAIPYFAFKCFLHQTFMKVLKRETFSKLMIVNIQLFQSERVYLLRLQVDELFVKVWLSNVINLALDVLQRTSFISWYARAIIRANSKLIPWYLHAKAALSLPALFFSSNFTSSQSANDS